MSTLTFILILLWIFSLSLYYPLNRKKDAHYITIGFDNKIPLIPISVIPYILFFPFVLTTTIYVWDTPYINQYLLAQFIGTATATSLWYFYPTGVKRPSIISNDIFSKILKLIYKYDHDNNALPSSHVFTSLISSYYLSLAFPSMALTAIFSGVLISLSTQTTKQHYFPDLVVGIIWAIAAISLSKLILPI